MRIGTLDWKQTKDTRKDEQQTTRAPQPNLMISSPSDNIAPNNVPQNGATPPVNPVAAAANQPFVAATGAPGSGSLGAPGSGAPGSGAGAARGGRTVMWKGKTLNMDTTRSALVQAAEEEQRVAQAQAAAANGVATNGAVMDESTQALHAHIATILTGMNEMCGGLQEIYGTVAKIADRDSNSERVFNTLHAELSDYKKDFIYEHLKPVIRPLLFLYDSLEQFEDETQRFDGDTPTSSTQSAPIPGMMPTRAVRQNTVYFREQLVEALRICEVTPMETPEGAFNARFHKAIKTVPVAPELDGQIQKVVRSGWFLNGQLLRAAEVVVGKAKSSV